MSRSFGDKVGAQAGIITEPGTLIIVYKRGATILKKCK